VDPAFGEARIVEISAQARPTLPDNLPLLEVMAPRRLRINGLYRHGFLIAPALLDATLQWMELGASPLAASFGLRIQHAT
jgi:glycine oxidase